MSFLVLQGDARQIPLRDGSVHCVVTSPPYFSLRDYGTGTWTGGNADCDHLRPPLGGTGKETIDSTTAHENRTRFQQYRDICGKCGAVRVDKQIGLENSLDAYVSQLVAVFREVRRVLHPSGVVFLNLGDSYAGSWGNYSGQNRGNGKQREIITGSQAVNPAYDGLESWRPATSRPQAGLKPKDLCLIPARVALALQEDGWWIRSDIIWAKKSPMPESVSDRPTSAYEHIFLLAKNEKYFFDSEAVKEPTTNGERYHGAYDHRPDGFNKRNGRNDDRPQMLQTRNMRNFWLLGPEPTAFAHFALMPTEIVKRCVLAGSPVGGIVFDPFGGVSTTALVADRLGRHGITLELSADYCLMAQTRLANETPLFATVVPPVPPAVQGGLWGER